MEQPSCARFKQWGMKMQDDLDDGLDWLVQQGITDPKRVCMVAATAVTPHWSRV